MGYFYEGGVGYIAHARYTTQIYRVGQKNCTRFCDNNFFHTFLAHTYNIGNLQVDGA